MLDYVLPLSLLAAFGEGDVVRSAQTRTQATVRTYVCDFGMTFSVRFMGKRATVVTRSHRYELTARPFSLGPRFGSETVAFAQDDDRAVLVGADDGPYRNCIEARAGKLI